MLISTDARRVSLAGWQLALCSLAVFMVILDATIVAVALPSIRVDLHIGAGSLAWVVNAYTLTFAGFLLIGGRSADLFGPRRAFLTGLALFSAASLACALAPTADMLLAARAAQGLGGALLMPTTLTIVTHAFSEGHARTRALSTWSMVGAVAAAAGPPAGGLITQGLGWRWVFLLNVPIGILGLIAAVLLLPMAARAERQPVDFLGALLITSALTALVEAIVHAGQHALTDAGTLIPGVAGLGLLVAFAIHQRRTSSPLIPPGVLSHPPVRAANLVIFLLGLGFFATPVLISVYLQTSRHYTPIQAGLAFLPIGVALGAGARAAGKLTSQLGPRLATLPGALLAVAGFCWIGFALTATSPYVTTLLIPGCLFGLGVGAAFTPITVAATTGVPRHLAGLASGVLNTTRQISSAIGLATLTAIADNATALTTGTAHAFLTASAAAAIATLGVALLPARSANITPAADAKAETRHPLESVRNGET